MKKRVERIPQLVVVGSVGLDSIRTAEAYCEDVLGGSCVYACAAASFFVRTGMVGVVGTDYPASGLRLMNKLGVDLAGLQRVEGKTFRWSGVYEKNMDHRSTLSTHLNVFADFQPELPEAYRSAPFVFLANIAPALQLHVLDQVKKPRFVMADTMDLWIRETRADVLKVLRRVHMIALNESEARMLTGAHNLVTAARAILQLGPRHVLIKKGEHGSMLFSARSIFLTPAFPLEQVKDPTGAGDTFAGGFMGRLAAGGRVTATALERAMRYGSVTASFTVEAFSLNRLAKTTRAQIEQRAVALKKMCAQP